MSRVVPSEAFPPVIYWTAARNVNTAAEADAEVARHGLTVGRWQPKPISDGATGYNWRFAVYKGTMLFGYGYARELKSSKEMDSETRHDLAEHRRKKRGIPSAAEKAFAAAQAETETFNALYPAGTPVRYWTGARRGPGVESKTRTSAQVVGGHTAAVWVFGSPGCIALTHIEVIEPEPRTP
jgi:hypothetical protein